MTDRRELSKQVRRTAALLVAAGVRHMQVRLGGRLYRLTLEPVFAVGPEEFKAGVRPPGSSSPLDGRMTTPRRRARRRQEECDAENPQGSAPQRLRLSESLRRG